MSALIDRCAEVVADLQAAGVRATQDVRSVAPVCVLLVPPDITLDVNCGGTATFTAYLIAPPPANADAWKALDALAAQVAAVVPVESIRVTSYSPDDSAALPAFALTWQESLNWP